MHIAIYADAESQPFKRLHDAITLADVGQPPEVHSDLNLFCMCFRAVAYHPDLIIIMPTCLDELEALAVVRDLFASIRTIVILPEREPPTISLGHLFHPSFITFDDDDFQDLALILKHLCSHRPCTTELC
jgi:hypothetical protein